MADDAGRQETLDALGKMGVDVASEQQRGSLLVIGKDDWRHDGPFDMRLMAARVQGIVDRALSDGYSALWIAVEMAWTKSPDIAADEVARWEGMWNDLLVGMPVVLLCMYDREQFSPAFLRPELHTHPFVINDARVYPSCYYQGLPGGRREPAGSGLDWMLEYLRSRPAEKPLLDAAPA